MDTITGPVGRFYLWKEWNTHTVVDSSSTQTLTLSSLLPSTSSFENTGSLFPSRTKPLVLFWLSKNPTGVTFPMMTTKRVNLRTKERMGRGLDFQSTGQKQSGETSVASELVQ